MNERRLHLGLLVQVLTVAVGAMCAVILSDGHFRGTVIRSPSEVGESMGVPDMDVADPVAAPFVRKPIPIDPRFVPVPIAVESGRDLERIGPHTEGELWTYAYVNPPPATPGYVSVAIRIANGFGGFNADVLFDPKEKSARVVVANCYDCSPFYRTWSDVQGAVRITSWALRSGTLVEVDVRGNAEGQEYSLDVCVPLLVQPFELMREETSHFR